MNRAAFGRGFTLVEVLVGLAILSLLVGLGFVNLRRPQARAVSQGLAWSLAGVFREARYQAISRQRPVAVVFPAEPDKPHAGSCYVLEGETHPRVTRVFRFDKDFPGAMTFIGCWDLDASLLQDPAATPRLGRPVVGSKPSVQSLDQWCPAPALEGSVFLFTPDGSLLTNDLPTFDNEFHVLATHGVRFAATSPPPGSPPDRVCFAPTAVGSPWTLSLSPAGAVRVTPGILASAGGIDVVDRLGPSATPAQAPQGSPEENRPPEVARPIVLPTPNPALLPAGADGTVALEGYLTLAVTATDPDGDPLYCSWEAKGGGLSSRRALRMEWEPAQGVWRSVWHWSPPADAAPPDRFQLSCQVEDPFGGVGIPVEAAVQDIEVLPPGKLFFHSDRDGDSEIYVAYSDGTGLRRLTFFPGSDSSPTASADGTVVVFHTRRYGSVNLCRIYADGSGYQRLTYGGGFGGWNVGGSVSPAGDQMAWIWEPSGPGWQLWVMDLDGGSRRLLADLNYVGPFYGGGTCWSPEGDQIVYPRRSSSQWDLYVIQTDGTGERNLTSSPGTDQNPAWSPDPADPWIWFQSDRDGNCELYKVRPDGTGLTRMTATPQYEGSPTLSPDGQYVVFQLEQELFRMDTTGANRVRLVGGDGASYRVPFMTP